MLHRQLVNGRSLGRLNPVLPECRLCGPAAITFRIMRIKKHFEVSLVQIFFVGRKKPLPPLCPDHTRQSRLAEAADACLRSRSSAVPSSIRGKQNVHFSALLVCQLKYTFLYGQPVEQETPTSARILVDEYDTVFIPLVNRTPEGQDATQGGLRQCSQILGKYNINVCSNSRILSVLPIPVHIRIPFSRLIYASQVIFPIGAPFDASMYSPVNNGIRDGQRADVAFPGCSISGP